MSARRITRRSLLAASAGAVGGGLLRAARRRSRCSAGRRPRPSRSAGLDCSRPQGATVELGHPRGSRGSRMAGARPGRCVDALPWPGRQVEQLGLSGGKRSRAGSAPRGRPAGGRADLDGGSHSGAGSRHAPAERRAAAPGRRQRWRGSRRVAPTRAAAMRRACRWRRRPWRRGRASRRSSPGGRGPRGWRRPGWRPNTARCGWRSSTTPRTPTATRPAKCRRCCGRSMCFTATSTAGTTSATTSSIDLYGRIFEARAGGIDEPVVGAQAGGYNLVSTGIAVLGTFMAVPISTAGPRRAGSAARLEAVAAWSAGAGQRDRAE